MDSVEPEDARNLPGLRLALTTRVPGPWGEAAKAIFPLKKLGYVVRQTVPEANEALIVWTGHRNARQAIYGDERDRVLMFGLARRGLQRGRARLEPAPSAARAHALDARRGGPLGALHRMHTRTSPKSAA